MNKLEDNSFYWEQIDKLIERKKRNDKQAIVSVKKIITLHFKDSFKTLLRDK
jgi:hypothetical protein